MASLPRVIDVEDAPELLRLVEEVRETDHELVIRQGGEDVAVLSPVKHRAHPQPQRVDIEEDKEAFRSSAGSWEGLIDADKFTEEIYVRRKAWSRPPVEL